MCWAYNSYITEHSPDGSLIMEAKIPIKLRSYRAFKHTWVGTPSRPPDITSESVVVDDEFLTVVHVSWNGDTRTAKWKFSEVRDGGVVHELGTVRRKQFETRFEHNHFAKRVIAVAIDDNGVQIGKSRVVETVQTNLLTDPTYFPDSGTEFEQEMAFDDDDLLGGIEEPLTFQFLIGLACGCVLSALLWVGLRQFRRRDDRRRPSRDEAKYMPLQEVTD